MDPLSSLIDAPRARGAFLLRVPMARPWAIRIRDEAPLTVVTVTQGSAVFTRGSDAPVRLDRGDLLLVRGPEPYDVGDEPGREPLAVIHPGNRSETPVGVSLDLPMTHGIRTWGNDPGGEDALLVGNYSSVGEVGARMLSALPPALVLRGDEWDSPLVGLLHDNLQREAPGQVSLLDRLLDALVVAAVQQWAATADDLPTWLRAGDDREVGRALALIHDRPEAPWTLGSLAGEVGLSRAGFSRRFGAAVGESPIAYLSAWRLALAADLLAGTDDTVASISRAVGYSSPFTFSDAFQRSYGVRPVDHRRRGRTG
ncbi:AraC family transcriptional regulator [Nocardioides cynanchi]|uniref:AraC family transcriptional regulator n=1 Tax=Nocardioides cynanchi TaxID=2558918 RepID=UPI0012452550|nr:AraC family transcriptional regulator [Nocardioides cynanchi]